MSWQNEIDENTLVISDNHFYHYNINKYEPSRLEAMKKSGFDDPDEFMIAQWNSVVSEDDLVLHLGDLAGKHGLDVLHKLNGRVLLVLGNHDISSINKIKRFIEEFPEKLEVVYGVKDCQPYLLKPQWASGLIRELCGKKIMFSHYPLVTEDQYTKGKAAETKRAMTEVFKRENCDLNVHGHVHTKDAKTDKSREINVSVERIDFKPQRLCDLVNKFVN